MDDGGLPKKMEDIGGLVVGDRYGGEVGATLLALGWVQPLEF